MLVQIFTIISLSKLSAQNIQIVPELVFPPDPLIPEIKNRLFKLCKIEETEIKDIIFSVFETTTSQGKKYVKPQNYFSYFSVNHLIASKEASQIEIKMGKKGVTNKNELQMYFQNKNVTNNFLQEIQDLIKKSETVFNGELRNVFDKVFVLKFYEALDDIHDENAITNAIFNIPAVKNTFIEKMIEELDSPYYFIEIITADESETVNIKPRLVEILNELIDSGELVIQELFEFRNKYLTFEKKMEDKINEIIKIKLLSEFPRHIDGEIYFRSAPHRVFEKPMYSWDCKRKVKSFMFLHDIIKRFCFQNDFRAFVLQFKAIIQFAEEFKKLHEYVKFAGNKESTKQNIEDYENTLSGFKKDTETTVLIQNHINLIKALIKHSNEQERIFNVLNDESVAFNLRIIFKDSNEELQSEFSKYYTLKEEVLHEVEEFRPIHLPLSQ